MQETQLHLESELSPEEQHLTVARKELPVCRTCSLLCAPFPGEGGSRTVSEGRCAAGENSCTAVRFLFIQRFLFILFIQRFLFIHGFLSTGMLVHCEYDCNRINAGMLQEYLQDLRAPLGTTSTARYEMHSWPLSVAQWIFTSLLNLNTTSKLRG